MSEQAGTVRCGTSRAKFGPIIVVWGKDPNKVLMQDTRTGEAGIFVLKDLEDTVEEFFNKHF